MAALLGLTSMDGLLPIPVDTISCVLSSKIGACGGVF